MAQGAAGSRGPEHRHHVGGEQERFEALAGGADGRGQGVFE